MKVCVLTSSFPAYYGDAQSPFIYRFAKSLADNKVDVNVVCPFYKNSKSKNEKLDGINVHRFYYFIKGFQTFTEVGSIPDAVKTFYGKLQLPFFCIFYFLKAFNLGRKSDIIHAQWIIPSAFIGVLLKKFYGRPLIATTRGTELVLSSKSFIWRPFLNYTMKRCDYLVSNNTKHSEIFRSFGVDEKKIIHIPNGLDYGLYRKRHKGVVRKKFGFGFDVKMVLFVGNLIKLKRVDILIKAFNGVANKYPRSILIIIGSGPLRHKLDFLVNKLRLKSRVRFIGRVEPKNVAIFMNAADVLVLPSSSEGRPNVVLEALASGLPVVTTNVGDIGNFIRDGYNGFIVGIDDINSLERKLCSLLYNKKLSRKFSRNGFETVKKINPSWEDAGKEYIKLYGDLLKN